MNQIVFGLSRPLIYCIKIGEKRLKIKGKLCRNEPTEPGKHPQGLHKSKPGEVSAVRGEESISSHPYPRSYLLLTTHSSKGKFSFLQWRLSGQINLRTGPMPAEDGQHETNSIIFLQIFVSDAFLWAILHFYLIGLLFENMASDFDFLWCVCVFLVPFLS